MSTKTPHAGGLHVVLLWVPDALHGTLLATLDVLRTAATFWHLRHPDSESPFSWEILSPPGTRIRLPGISSDKLCARRRGKPDPLRTLLVIPALHVANSPSMGEFLEANKAVLDHVHAHAEAGGWIAATYTGIALPAKLGMLDGARINAPWAHEAWLSRIFTRCDFSDPALIGRHERLFTCVAPGIQTDFMLAILRALGYPDLAEASAQVLVSQGRRQELMPDLVRKNWVGTTSDSPVYRAMEWLNAHIDQPYNLAALAQAAATSERTLLRHFKQVAGKSPLEYLQEIRVERAKMLLEVTLQTVHTISQACGYSDVSSFRRIFREATGMTPTGYRTRFTLRARRRYWRVETIS